MKNPFRFWMTSGIAIMVAAVSGGRAFAGEERLTLTRVSRYSVSETVHRIEASAQRHGMHVLVCLPQVVNEQTGEARYVIVLESSQGGTPVQMETPDAQPDLLMSVVLKTGQEGGTEVFMYSGALRDLPEGLSAQVQHDLADMPAMLEEALSV
jgi:uncharacterized protein (DUF302 family)